jgi:hypothetical protein
MAVYIAAAYRLSPLDPVTSLISNNIEDDIVTKFCKANVKDIKQIRAENELRDEHNKHINERASNYDHPDKYTIDDVKEYINHNKKAITSETKSHAFKGAIKSPIVILTLIVMVSIIIFTVMCWVNNYKSTLKWTMTFICWILIYITGFTIVQIIRLEKNIKTIIDHNLDKIDIQVLKKIKKQCPKKVV